LHNNILYICFTFLKLQEKPNGIIKINMLKLYGALYQRNLNFLILTRYHHLAAIYRRTYQHMGTNIILLLNGDIILYTSYASMQSGII